MGGEKSKSRVHTRQGSHKLGPQSHAPGVKMNRTGGVQILGTLCSESLRESQAFDLLSGSPGPGAPRCPQTETEPAGTQNGLGHRPSGARTGRPRSKQA